MTIKNEVKMWLASEEEEDRENLLSDLLRMGCDGGTVPDMVHTVDTLAFYERNKKEINNILSEELENFGCTLDQLIHDFDKSDPLVLELHNQNNVAHYCYHHLAQQISI